MGLPPELEAERPKPPARPPAPPAPVTPEAPANAEIRPPAEETVGDAGGPPLSRAGRRPPSRPRGAPAEAIHADALLLASGTLPVSAEHAQSVAEDDPYQCASGGRGPLPGAARCPHCGRGLLVARG